MQEWILAAALAVLLAAGMAYRHLDIETLDLKSAAKLLLRPIVAILKLGLATWVDRATQTRRLVFWSGLNLVVIGILIFVEPGVTTLAFAALMAALHLLSFVSTLLVIDEETDIWNGLLTAEQAVFRSARLLKYPSVLLISTLWAMLFLPLAVRLWDQVTPFPLFVAVPPPPCEPDACAYLSYLAATVYQLPFVEWLLRDLGTVDAKLSEWPGPYLGPALAFIALTLIFGAFKVLVFQKKAIGDLVVAFGRATDDAAIRFLRERAERAPEFIQQQLLAHALNHDNAKMRRRYTEAILKARFLDFSRIFLEKLHHEPNVTNKRAGIVQITAMVETASGDFDDSTLVAESIDALNLQMTRHREAHNPAVLQAMDRLLLAYVGLCGTNGWNPSSQRLARVYDLAALGNGDIRPAAFTLAAGLRPVKLCQWVVGHLTVANLADPATHAALTTATAQTEELIANRCAKWKRSSRTKLAKTITVRRMSLVRDFQKLGNGHFRRDAESIAPDDIGRVMAIVSDTIAALDRLKALIMQTLPELPANELRPTVAKEDLLAEDEAA